MREKTIIPSLENMGEATEFFENFMMEIDAPMKATMQVNVAVDEVLSNIIQYSGATSVTLKCLLEDGEVKLIFSDDGRKYDPTDKEDPDITLSADERDIGGLGIFMVKKTMDRVFYEYKNGKNVLTIVKSI